MKKSPIDAQKEVPKEPKKVKNKNNKESIVKIRADEEELKLLKEGAKNFKSVSDFIRFSCLKQEKKAIFHQKRWIKNLKI